MEPRNAGRIAIIGRGRMGSALRAWLRAAGFPVVSLGRRVRPPAAARVVMLAVPDDALFTVAKWLAATGDWSGHIVIHTSGVRTAAELAPLRAAGARVASMHPLMSFAPGLPAPPAGVLFALEGERAACRFAAALIRSWRGVSLRLQPQQKAAYHLAATLVSPAVVVQVAAAEAVLRGSGLPAAAQRRVRAGLLRLLRATSENLARGTLSAWTGPWARGDKGTLALHTEALRRLPDVARLHAAVGTAAARLLPPTSR